MKKLQMYGGGKTSSVHTVLLTAALFNFYLCPADLLCVYLEADVFIGAASVMSLFNSQQSQVNIYVYMCRN